MQQVATYEAVARACERLQADGQKITGDAVVALVGGNKGTVLQHIRAWRHWRHSEETPAAKEIPAEFRDAVLRLLGQTQAQAAAELRLEIDQAGASEAEALSALTTAEGRIEALTGELAALERQADDYREGAERAAAVAAQEIQDLKARVEALEVERKQLVEAGEAARVEAAKAQLQVERADQAAGKAEARVVELEGRIAELAAGKNEAEKGSAVAERHAQDLEGQLGKLEERIERQGQEYERRLERAGAKIELLEAAKEEMAQQLAAEKSVRRETEAAAALVEQRMEEFMGQSRATAEALQKNAALVEQLRQELEGCRQARAEADKRAALAEQKLAMLEGSEKKEKEKPEGKK